MEETRTDNASWSTPRDTAGRIESIRSRLEILRREERQLTAELTTLTRGHRRPRYRVIFSSRQDYRKSMMLLATLAAGLATVTGVLLAGHYVGEWAAALVVLAGPMAFLAVAWKTDLCDFHA